MKQKRDSGLGVSARRLAVALSAASPRADHRAVGFPLQSLTRILLVSICFAWSIRAICQNENVRQPEPITPAELAKLPVVDSSAIMKVVPLTYFPTGSSYADSIIVNGIIREQSSAGFFCGIFCHSGTVKIEVTQVEKGSFGGNILFAVIPCFVHRDEDIGKKIRLILTALPEDRDIGCLAAVWNTIDSHGVPFYFSEEDHIER